MNNYQNKIDFRLASTKVFLICLFMAFGSSKAFSQCTYVTTENGMETKLSIPCNFPVLESIVGAADMEQTSFDLNIKKWHANNPTLSSVNLTPRAVGGNYHIEIPFSNYSEFSVEKKKVVDAIPYFYKVIQERK